MHDFSDFVRVSWDVVSVCGNPPVVVIIISVCACILPILVYFKFVMGDILWVLYDVNLVLFCLKTDGGNIVVDINNGTSVVLDGIRVCAYEMSVGFDGVRVHTDTHCVVTDSQRVHSNEILMAVYSFWVCEDCVLVCFGVRLICCYFGHVGSDIDGVSHDMRLVVLDVTRHHSYLMLILTDLRRQCQDIT